MTWSPLPPAPKRVRLAPMSDWRHRPTPPEVLARRSDGGSLPAVWHDPEAGLVGILTVDDQIAWELSEEGSVELNFQRPGQAPGQAAGFLGALFLRASEPTPIPIASAEPFDDDHMVWFIALVQVLAGEVGVSARMVEVKA